MHKKRFIKLPELSLSSQPGITQMIFYRPKLAVSEVLTFLHTIQLSTLKIQIESLVVGVQLIIVDSLPMPQHKANFSWPSILVCVHTPGFGLPERNRRNQNCERLAYHNLNKSTNILKSSSTVISQNEFIKRWFRYEVKQNRDSLAR